MQSDKNPVAELTKKEAYAVAEFIDCNLLDYIRSDTDIDSMDWLKSVVHAYEKMCKASGYVGLTENAEGENDSDKNNSNETNAEVVREMPVSTTVYTGIREQESVVRNKLQYTLQRA